MNKQEYIKMYDLEDNHFWFLGKRAFVDSTLTRYKSVIKKILDIGSGTGGMTNYMSRFGAVTGIEKNHLALSLSKKRNINVVYGVAEKLNFKNNTFDLVTIFDVLYHKNVSDESKVLKEAYRVLKPNGLILITDSAHSFLKGPHDIATHGLRRYSLTQMAEVVENANFEIVKKSYIFMTITPAVILKRLILDRIIGNNSSDVNKLPEILNKIFLILINVEAAIYKHFSLPFGTSVLILAKKR